MSTIKNELEKILRNMSYEDKLVLGLALNGASQTEMIAEVGVEAASILGNALKKFYKSTSKWFSWEGSAAERRELFINVAEEYKLNFNVPPRESVIHSEVSHKTFDCSQKDISDIKQEEKIDSPAPVRLTLKQIIENYNEINSSIDDCHGLIKIYTEKLKHLTHAKEEAEKTLWIQAN